MNPSNTSTTLPGQNVAADTSATAPRLATAAQTGRKRVAVIGAGISGLATAWLLRDTHDVVLLERDHEAGGHARTRIIETAAGAFPIDLGFVVFNNRNYPLLNALFRHLGVAFRDTEMSFSYSERRVDGRVGIEYAGSNLNTLFAQRRNLLRPGFLRMTAEIVRFNRLCKRLADQDQLDTTPLGSFLERYRFGARIRDHYLLPMTAAIWSCPTAHAAEFPIHRFVEFFRNHGLLDLENRPQWHTVEGGSRRYVEPLAAALGERLRLNHEVLEVERRGDLWQIGVQHAGVTSVETFDMVVLATHADTTTRLLGSYGEWLAPFRFSKNRAVVHSDVSLMPRTRRAWSSWNYLGYETPAGATPQVTATYWMNRLHGHPEATPILLSLNPVHEPPADRVFCEQQWDHPVFDAFAGAITERLGEHQARDGLFYAGAWTAFGFHEDGLRSALRVAQALGVQPPWTSEAGHPAPASERPQAA